MDETTALLKDTEKFITDILGKIDLPPEVDKQRIDLSQRLRKLLNITDEDPLKQPQDMEPEEMYGDVAIGDADQNVFTDTQETYDDVAAVTAGGAAEPQEMYADVADIKSGEAIPDGSDSQPEEMYADVASIDPSVHSKSSTATSDTLSLDTQNVGEPKKASEIKNKIYEGFLEKYRTKGLIKLSRWQRRYCILTSLAFYYYADPKDSKQKGTIVLPSSGSTLQEGCPTHPEVKDGKLCFELGNAERHFLFKAEKQSDLETWIQHINSALKTKLTDEDSSIMRTKSIRIAREEKEEEEPEETEDLYELVDTYRKEKETAIPAIETEPEFEGELYEETEQFSIKESSGSSNEGPALPSRKSVEKHEELEDYELPGVTGKPKIEPRKEVHEDEGAESPEEYELPGVGSKPTSAVPKRQSNSIPDSPMLPPRNSPSANGPQLPPRTNGKSASASKKPPDIPIRTTPPTAKRAPPLSPKPAATEETKPSPPATLERKPDVVPDVFTIPPIRPKPKGEQFDYARVYVAMWDCCADDEDDLTFSRGNQLYIREKIPNSDWWVASMMDSPEIRVGLVPRNYIMAAYEM